MSCVNNYNVLKEGDLYNDTIAATYDVTTSGVLGLYDGDYSKLAYTIPVSGTSSLVLEFGEYYDICNIKYYVSPINLSDIFVSYGINSSTEHIASITSSGTYVFADIGGHVGFLQITHSGTTDVGVYHLDVEAFEHEYIGFGESSISGAGFSFMDNTPVGCYSSDPFEVVVYNEWDRPMDINVAIAPTTSGADNYVYVGTTATGTFYGVNDKGPSQPAFVRISTQDESLDLDSLEDLLENWNFQTGAGAYLDNKDGYLRFCVYEPSVSSYRKGSIWNWYNQVFLVNKHEFTANQSFTISIDLRIVSAPLENMEDAPASHTACKFLLGFTNMYPIYEYSIRTKTANIPTYDSLGQSWAALWVGPLNGYLGEKDLAVGAIANDNDFDSYENATNLHCVRNRYNDCPIISYVGLEALSENVFMENSYSDGTENALWRTLKLSYDHQTHTAYYYLDQVLLTTYQFSNASFMEACKFFFGFDGAGGITFDVRNFNVEVDTVYRVHHNQTYAAVYSSSDPDNHGPEKIINRKYGGTYYPDCWISDYDPVNGDHFEIGFGSPQTIDAVRMKQTGKDDVITISGSLVGGPQYVMDRVFFYFDTGDVRYVDFLETPYVGLSGWDVSYFTTLSGTVESVKGVTSVSGVIDTLHDRGVSGGRTNVLTIDELEFYTLSSIRVNTHQAEVVDTYPWRCGRVRNLFRHGSANVYELQNKDLYDVSTKEDVHELVRGYDYNVSSPVWDKNASVSYRHYAETMFIRDERGTGAHMEANIQGRVAWMWRFFEEAVSLKALLLSIASATQIGDAYNSRLDKWKVQYLREGGNPGVVGDWVDIPPIVQVYVGGGEFATYTQYMVDHNDGEYYTEFLNSMDVTGAVNLPAGLFIRRNTFNSKTVLNSFSGVVDVYVEFDKTYRTQGIRVVFADAYVDVGRITPASGYTISTFVAYANKAVGSYVSPVFDTGTRLNTERIHVDTENYGGSATVLYRSSAKVPAYRHDTAFENWEDMGAQFAGLGENDLFDPFYLGADMVSYGSKIYCIGRNSGQFIIYDTISRKWEYGPPFPVETGGQVIRPDYRTGNSTVIVGDSIICAAASQGGTGVWSSSMLRYYITENEYSYSGWYAYPYQRQPEAVNAVMVSDGSERVFFLSVAGDITVFYLSTGELDTEGRMSMPLHGSGSRSGMIPVYHGGKIYVVGGTGNSMYKIDIYSINEDTWYSGADMPYPLSYVRVFYYADYIYAFPSWGSSSYSAFMKYDIEEDSWVVISTLGYNYKTSYLDSSSYFIGNFPVPRSLCQFGDYVYIYQDVRKDFRRTKLKKELWESGYLPNKDEVRWFNSGGTAWNEVTTSGELMPQDRYIQYKVILESDEDVVAPVLKGSTVVQPVVVEDVPASGVSSVYLKTGISLEGWYEAWYTGFDIDYNSSLVYAVSDDGYDFYNNLSAVDITTISGGAGQYCYNYADAAVIKNIGLYEMWATHAEIEEYGFRWGNIHRSISYNGYDWDTFSHVIGRNTEGTYDTYSIYGPVVINDSGYEMWYTGVDNSGVHRILHADSFDGAVWSNIVLSQDRGTYSLEPDADFAGAKRPSVVKRGGIYHMWYEGEDVEGVLRIIYCYSNDGVSWVGHEIVLGASDVSSLDVSGVGCPCVLYDFDTYHMWFTGYSSVSDIVYYAKSNGGVVWAGVEAVLTKNHQGDHDINKVGAFKVTTTREIEPPNVMKHVKLKMHNGYTS